MGFRKQLMLKLKIYLLTRTSRTLAFYILKHIGISVNTGQGLSNAKKGRSVWGKSEVF